VFVNVNAEILIHSDAETIWDFAIDPENWTASNPGEHFGLEVFEREGKPALFHQRESVAGRYGDLRGQYLYVERPKVLVWSGTTTYRWWGGLLRSRLTQGGVFRIETGEAGCRVTHDVYSDFPDTLYGKFMAWVSLKVLRSEKAAYDHTYRELVYFKQRLDSAEGSHETSTQSVPAEP
jgi:hypothetical protein